jgi:hypothetical protein
MSAARAPALEVELALGSTLRNALGPSFDDARQDVAAALDSVLAKLGVPGRARVSVTEVLAGPAFPFELTVGSHRCRYPDTVIRQHAEVIIGTHLCDGSRSADVVSAFCDEQPSLASRLVALACVEAIKVRPSVLLGEPQLAAYSQQLSEAMTPSSPWPSERLGAVLRSALDLWVSIADVEGVAAVLTDSSADAAEDLIAALRPQCIDIELGSEYLRVMTETAGGTLADVEDARDQVYDELGLRFPDCRFVLPVDGSSPHEVRFWINGLPATPVLGLAPGTVYLNETPEELDGIGVEAVAACRVSGRVGSVVDAGLVGRLSGTGRTTWNPTEYLVLALTDTLRIHCWRFIDVNTVGAALDTLAPIFPTLVGAVGGALTVGELARLQRRLVRQAVSIRNLPRILDAVVEACDPGFMVEPRMSLRGSVADRDLEAFVRSALARQLHEQHRWARSETVVAWLIDPAIETLVTTQSPLSAESRDSLVALLARRVAELGPNVPVPVLLTTGRARAELVAAIADELPLLPVMAFDELVAEANVRPVARLSLAS